MENNEVIKSLIIFLVGLILGFAIGFSYSDVSGNEKMLELQNKECLNNLQICWDKLEEFELLKQ